MTEGDFYNRPNGYNSLYPERTRYNQKKQQVSRHTKSCNQQCQRHDELVHAIRLITAKEFDKKRLHKRIEEKIHNCGNTFGGCGRPEFTEARGKESKVSLCEDLSKYV